MSDDQNYSFWLYEFSLLSIIDFLSLNSSTIYLHKDRLKYPQIISNILTHC